MTKKTLVVIGGGAAGHQIAHDLMDEMAVTLVDPKTYWEVPMAFPRLLADPDALPARMAYRDFLGSAKHLQGRATAITEKVVTVATDTGDVILPFDYAVIATGSRYRDPLIKAEAITEQARTAEIADAHAGLKSAGSVVIAGGGPVGVEIAAELRAVFPNLKLTLVHGADRLLEAAPSRFAKWARHELSALGIDVILDDMVVSPAVGEQPLDGTVQLATGRALDAAIIVWAVGTQPMTGLIKGAWPELVDERGLLKTDPFLRLRGHANIFVSGDVTDLPEARLAITASFHVKSIVANLKALAAAGSAADVTLKSYKPVVPGKGMGKMMVVTLGPSDGLTSLPFGQFRASFMARAIKSKHMFVPQSRKAVGLAS